MSDPISPTPASSAPLGSPPPLPVQPAAEAAAHAPASGSAPTYDPATDPDNTGVPTSLGGEFDDVGRGFLRALFDLSFRTFITRRLASVFYLVGLVAIAIGFIVYLVTGLVHAISLLSWNLGGGISLLVATIIIVPIVTFLAIVILRFVIEAVVALIAIAENTERTAENTRR